MFRRKRKIVMSGLDPATQGRCTECRKAFTIKPRSTQSSFVAFMASRFNLSSLDAAPLGGRVKPGHDEVV